MGESKQEILREIARWEQETGFSAEATYNADPSETFTGMTEEQRERGVELWKRYKETWEAEQKPPTGGPLGAQTEPAQCQVCGGSGESQRLGSGPPGPCATCGGTGVIGPPR